jgi:putative ABC transport system substrate-binding protein
MRVSRLVWTILLIALVLVASPAASASDAKAVRIGWLGLASPDPEVSRVVDAFKQGLRPLGYEEGRNLLFEYRWAHGRSEALPGLAAELVGLKVDIIAVANTLGAVAAQQATSTTPIVILGPDPEPLGLGERLARPGGNITGVTLHAGPEIGGKYLQLLKEAAPRISLVALLLRPENPGHVTISKGMDTAARSLKLRIERVAARTADDLGPAFDALSRSKADALVVLADPIFFVHRQRIADLAAKSRLPAIYGLTEHVEAGGLMAYSADFDDVARRAATHVDRILKGAKPGELPIDRPKRFELVVNARTARALRLTLPPALLARADRVIE